MGSSSKVDSPQNSLIHQMLSLLNICGLCLWLYLASQNSKQVFSQNTIIQGTVFVDGSASIASTDDDFICATMDWWPPEKCDYGTCSWGTASLLNLVSLDYVIKWSFDTFFASFWLCTLIKNGMPINFFYLHKNEKDITAKQSEIFLTLSKGVSRKILT